MGVGGRHAPAALPPGKRPGTHCIAVWMGVKILASTGIFVFVRALSFFLPSLLPLYPLCPFISRPHVTFNTTQTSIPPEGFEPANPAIKRSQTYASTAWPQGSAGIRSPDRPAHSKSLYQLSYRRGWQPRENLKGAGRGLDVVRQAVVLMNLLNAWCSPIQQYRLSVTTTPTSATKWKPQARLCKQKGCLKLTFIL